jgi:uncharacterized membrane protein YdbT with pleckstrin-like domain
MGFPKNLLADHEKLVFDLRPHWVALVTPVLWGVVILALETLSSTYLFNDNGKNDWWEWAITIILVLAFISLTVMPAAQWHYTRFVLTTDRLITRRGIIAKHSKEIPLERINDVAFSQSMLERALGAGDLLIESAGERGQNRISNVRKPEQVQLMIYKETETNNNRSMPPPTGTPMNASIPDQIEALARLKDQGVISDIEFESKKQELLKRM